MSSAILLIAHGSRRSEANRDLAELADMLRARRPEKIVEFAYLELAQPPVPAGLARCRERGATQIDMLPWFLSAGTHVTGDLARFRDEFSSQHPDVAVVLRPPLGLHPLMIDILLDRLAATTPADNS